MRIAITGTHGTGKTTLARALSKELKLPLIAEIAREAAKNTCVDHASKLLSNIYIARKFQWEVLRQQVNAEDSFCGKFVSDRCTLDCFAYWKAYGIKSGHGYKQKCFQRYYDLLVYVPIEFRCPDDGFRDTDEILRSIVDEYIVKYLPQMCHPHITVTGNIEERIAKILDFVKRMLGGKL